MNLQIYRLQIAGGWYWVYYLVGVDGVNISPITEEACTLDGAMAQF